MCKWIEYYAFGTLKIYMLFYICSLLSIMHFQYEPKGSDEKYWSSENL